MQRLSFISFLLFMAGMVVAAQVQTPKMTYQGRLTSPDSSVKLNRSVPVKFSLYTQETGGEALWSESLTVTPDVEGNFSVTLFEKCGSKEIESGLTFFETLIEGRKKKALWLGLTIGKGSTKELTPRHMVGVVPQAHRARAAYQAHGHFKVPGALVVTDVEAKRLEAPTIEINVPSVGATLDAVTVDVDILEVEKKFTVDVAAEINTLVLAEEKAEADPYVPMNGIILWYGEEAKIPDGWEVVTELTGRFPMGAGEEDTAGEQGGSATVTLTEKHLPAHTHTINYAHPYGRNGKTWASSTSSGGEQTWVHTKKTTVELEENDDHKGSAFSILPPYKGLYYIRRVK